MPETLLRAVKTTLLATDVYLALRDAWVVQVGSEPSRPQLLTLLSQVWLETGSGTESYGYNLGGIKHVPGDEHDYYQVATVEDDPNGKAHTVVGEFRSYESLAAAAQDFVHIVNRDAGAALSRAVPDLNEFAHDLKLRGYYTAAEHDYSGGLQARYKQLQALIAEDTVPALPVAIARTQPAPGTDDDAQPTPPGDLPEPDDAA